MRYAKLNEDFDGMPHSNYQFNVFVSKTRSKVAMESRMHVSGLSSLKKNQFHLHSTFLCLPIFGSKQTVRRLFFFGIFGLTCYK